MRPTAPSSRTPHQHHRQEPSRVTLLAFLLVLLVPGFLVAVALGWQPPGFGEMGLLRGWRGSGGGGAPVTTPPARAAWALPDGWFFGETATASGEGAVRGYPVTDADGIAIWSAYDRLGGLAYLGYPLSHRFAHEGAVLQVFQRGVLRFDEAPTGVVVVHLLDELHAAGHDAKLKTAAGIPELSLPPTAPATGRASDRVGWVLRAFPGLAAYLETAPDADALLGLPTSTVEDMGAFSAVRFQGGALQQWKQAMPWAPAGGVTLANVGTLAREAGLYPPEPFAPTVVSPEERPDR